MFLVVKLESFTVLIPKIVSVEALPLTVAPMLMIALGVLLVEQLSIFFLSHGCLVSKLRA